MVALGRRVSIDSRVCGSGRALAATSIVALLLFPLVPGSAAVAEPLVPRAFELVGLRTATSATFAQPDGSMKTVLHAQPIHYREQDGGWAQIRRRFVDSGRSGFRWRNEAAGFVAELRSTARDGLVRYDAGTAGFALTLEDAVATPGAKVGEAELVYPAVFSGVDLEYELLGNGLKETLVLSDASAPATYRFRLEPLPGKPFDLQPRGDGGFEVRDGVSATPVALIRPPVVNDSQRVTVEDALGLRSELIDSPPALGKVTARATQVADGTYLISVQIDEQWLRSPDREPYRVW